MDYRKTYVNINLNSIRENILELKKYIPENGHIMAVVKADAYGHGDLEVLNTAIKAGASWAGVAIVKEALRLRQEGFKIPILLLGYCQPEAYETALKNDLTITLHSLDTARSANEFAKKRNVQFPVHLKLDTGMSRLGLSKDQLGTFLTENQYHSHLKLDGICSHLSSADEGDHNFSLNQLEKFHEMLNLIKQNFDPTWIHISNSAGSTELKTERGNLFRMGISMYGQFPSIYLQTPPRLKEAISFISSVIQVQEHPAGTPIGYSRTFRTQRKTKVATIAVGYADGYSRLLSNKGQALISGQRAPIIGNVCMDMTMVDVTDIPNVRINDEVVLIGKQGKEYISATEVANWIGTINYEVTSIISKRVPRYYISD